MLEAKVWLIRTRLVLKVWPKSVLRLSLFQCFMSKKGIDSSKHRSYTSWCHWGCKRIWVMQQNTHHIYHSQNRLSNQGPSQLCPNSQECREKGKYSDKKLFSFGQLGGVHHILLCFAFVLLNENTRCVWAGISIPITTCAPVPWEKYVRLLPRGEKNPRLSWRYDRARRLHYKVKGTCAKFQVS